MSYSFAVFVWADADAVGFECGASWWFVFCSGSSLACDVFHLVFCEAFVEVGECSEEVEDVFGGHAYVY